MAEWLYTIFEAQTDLNDVARDLANLACSFTDTGNVAIATRLKKAAAAIWNAEKNIGNATNDNINQSMKFAEQSSRTMLEAALAGAKLGRDSVS
jgi:hypothetical protein